MCGHCCWGFRYCFGRLASFWYTGRAHLLQNPRLVGHENEKCHNHREQHEQKLTYGTFTSHFHTFRLHLFCPVFLMAESNSEFWSTRTTRPLEEDSIGNGVSYSPKIFFGKTRNAWFGLLFDDRSRRCHHHHHHHDHHHRNPVERFNFPSPIIAVVVVGWLRSIWELLLLSPNTIPLLIILWRKFVQVSTI